MADITYKQVNGVWYDYIDGVAVTGFVAQNEFPAKGRKWQEISIGDAKKLKYITGKACICCGQDKKV